MRCSSRISRHHRVPSPTAARALRLGAGPFYGGSEPNLADLVVYCIVDAIATGNWDHVEASVLSGWPTLKGLHATVLASDLVKTHGAGC